MHSSDTFYRIFWSFLGAGIIPYTYQWPSTSSATSISSLASPVSTIPKTAADPTKPVSVPTKDTGVPYGLFMVGAVIIAAGVVYAKFLR